jgi:hypothetical protein
MNERTAASRAKMNKGELPFRDALTHAAIGLEAEFTLVVNDEPVRPEALFGDPRGFIHGPLMHRTGTSYHLPTGAAVYFDTGVIEVATAAMELDRGCMARAGRSLWESIAIVRSALDRWERSARRRARLVGFSTHYNLSLALAERDDVAASHLERLARALTYVLPAPVMILATNRRSTGVGVRPRPNRIEVTADFTPDSSMMIAAGSLIAGIVRDMLTWGDLTRRTLTREVPVIERFAPMPHTSRRGWLARHDCYPFNPFACDIDEAIWRTSAGVLSLRTIAHRIYERFGRSIARVADPFSLRLIGALLSPGGSSLLTLPDRPEAYEDVGRVSVWNGHSATDHLERSRYERALMNAVSGRPLNLFGAVCRPIRVRGWSSVVFRRTTDGAQLTIPIDLLVDRLDEWEAER